ncbi:hypothetical protein OG352_23155 [Streptomyces sp. NBC_01485]|uniref:DUF6801 domain-containing protein n=1 Tax=Streptomyces sp. NBC_01485 TaxID=2903884 RepID=UPI002E325B19|nr:DUF6801 domain-containing protein [Streptomyces sp. NBC_01485]
MKILPRAALRGWTAALVGLVTVFGAGFAVADPAPRSLHYTCPFPLIGDQPMTASVVWNASDTHVVGRATPGLPINTKATVGADVTRSLRFVGATTVEGTADVHAVVAAPEGDIPVTMTLRVAKTAVPESGPLTVPASGTIPSLVFHRPGPAKIVVGAIDLHLTPRDGNGDETLAGKVDTSCDLNNGQDGVLATFEVVPASPGPTASGTPSAPGEPGRSRPPGAPGTSEGPGAADPSESGSASASTSASAKVRGPSGSPSGTASASRSGVPDTASSDTASPETGVPDTGVPDTASPDTAATGGTHLSAPLRAVAAFLAVSAASAGIGWWGWRRRRAEGRDE